jgi:hypothetical protein
MQSPMPMRDLLFLDPLLVLDLFNLTRVRMKMFCTASVTLHAELVSLVKRCMASLKFSDINPIELRRTRRTNNDVVMSTFRCMKDQVSNPPIYSKKTGNHNIISKIQDKKGEDNDTSTFSSDSHYLWLHCVRLGGFVSNTAT